MQYARKLRKGDRVAIVSLSSGMLGKEFWTCYTAMCIAVWCCCKGGYETEKDFCE